MGKFILLSAGILVRCIILVALYKDQSNLFSFSNSSNFLVAFSTPNVTWSLKFSTLLLVLISSAIDQLESFNNWSTKTKSSGLVSVVGEPANSSPQTACATLSQTISKTVMPLECSLFTKSQFVISFTILLASGLSLSTCTYFINAGLAVAANILSLLVCNACISSAVILDIPIKCLFTLIPLYKGNELAVPK